MNREKIFDLLKSPCTPYIFVEFLYVIVAIIFYIRLNDLNRVLNQTFDIDRMTTQKDVMIASHVMSFEENASWYYLIWGIILIILGFVIPIVSSLINKSSYRRKEAKAAIFMVIIVMIIINIIVIISISKALLSPIIIATLILCAAGTLFAFGSSQS